VIVMLKDSATKLTVGQIRRDGGTQTRAQLDAAHLEELVAALEDESAQMPPVVVFFDGSEYWLADGFHRVEAYDRAGRFMVPCNVRQGTVRDAILFSVGANATHGLRRSNEDKQRAVDKLLSDPIWNQWSNVEIAKRCGVDEKMVRRRRDEQPRQSRGSDPETRIGADGKVRRVPERRPPAPPPPEPEPEEDFDELEGDAEEDDDEEDDEPPPRSEPRPRAPEPVVRSPEPPDEDPREVGYPRAGDRAPTPLEVARAAWERLSQEDRALFMTAIGAVEVAAVELLRNQRLADREYATRRAREAEIAKKIGRDASWRMYDFVLDGGEFAMVRLGIDYSVTAETLAHAYKARAIACHPDRGGDSAAMARLNADRDLVRALLDDGAAVGEVAS
jgi:hypothetical protein